MTEIPTAGSMLPDLALPDHNGVVRTLTELAAGDPLVVVFYRGWWCPKEQAFFRGLVGWQSEVEVAYTRIVAISVDPPGELAAFRAGLDARWTFLSDAGREWLPRLGLLETTDSVHRPYTPTVVVTYPDLRIHSVYNGYWFWGRPTLEDLRHDLRTVTRELRPDWEVPR
jgi:peroxiredoxin